MNYPTINTRPIEQPTETVPHTFYVSEVRRWRSEINAAERVTAISVGVAVGAIAVLLVVAIVCAI